jgi:CDP-glucose 4,6-dehydratase
MFNNLYHGKSVLITGNTGFKGSWLTLWLLKLGAEVVGFSDKTPTTPALFECASIEPRITHYSGDIRDLDSLVELIKNTRPEFLFHLAAQAIVSTSQQDPITTISTNTIGTANVLEALRLTGHSCVTVIITSDKCYENHEWDWGYRESDQLGGKDIYSGSKGAAEIIFHSYYHSFFKTSDANVRLATARAGNVIGGGDWAMDRIVADCMRCWANGQPVSIRNPNSTRPWQHVLEPLSGYLALAASLYYSSELSGEALNFGPSSHQNNTVVDLIQELSRHWGFSNSQVAYEIQLEQPNKEAQLLKLN